jgi:hypothetical protein
LGDLWICSGFTWSLMVVGRKSGRSWRYGPEMSTWSFKRKSWNLVV